MAQTRTEPQVTDGAQGTCGLSVGRAQRLVVGQVDGVGPASVWIALLIRVKPVVAQVGSWLAAHGAWSDLRALVRNAIGLVPPHPNRDHDHECRDVKQRY